MPNNQTSAGSTPLPKSGAGFTTTSLHSCGFTLVELLVAISIIAILSVVGLASFQGVRAKALDAKIKEDLNAIKMAYEMNYDAGRYKPLVGSNFASGAIPTQPNGSPYPCAVGPDTNCTTKSDKGYKISATLSDNTAIEVTSDQGTPVDRILAAAECANFKIRNPDESIRNGYSGESQVCLARIIARRSEDWFGAQAPPPDVWVKCGEISGTINDCSLTARASPCVDRSGRTGNMDYYNSLGDTLNNIQPTYTVPGGTAKLSQIEIASYTCSGGEYWPGSTNVHLY